MQCTGCSKPASAFQCPLCQAEDDERPTGFFCSQECFAANWLQHRDTAHKSGVAKVGSKRRRAAGQDEQPVAADAAAAKDPKQDKAAGKKSRKEAAAAAAAGTADAGAMAAATAAAAAADARRIPCWKPVATNLVAVAPVIPAAGTGRVVAGIAVPNRSEAGGASEALWLACIAAAQVVEASIHGSSPAADGQQPPQQFVVVAGSSMTAFAAAWALRCCNLQPYFTLALSTTETDLLDDPSTTHFTGSVRVAITTTDVLRLYGKKNANSVSLWTNRRSVVTLPDVANPDEFQALNARGIFFVATTASAKAGVVVCSPGSATFEATDVNHRVALVSATVAATSHFLSPFQHAALPANGGVKFDDTAATHLARGHLTHFIDRVVSVYSGNPQRCEDILETLLLHDWGSIVAGSDDVAHQKLAYILRALVMASSQFGKVQGSLRLGEMAVRVAARVSRAMVRLQPGSEAKRTANLALKATLCFVFATTPAPTLDTLATAWNITEVVAGLEPLAPALAQREAVTSRITKRYSAKLSPRYSEFLTVLMCFLYDALLKYVLTEEDVEASTMWGLLFQHEVGSLRQFLSVCDLLGAVEEGNGKQRALTAKPSTAAAVSASELALKDAKTVFLSAKKAFVTAKALPTASVPITGARGRDIQKLKDIAAEEVLSAMPTQPIPLYVGDVGNLIGIWSKFNARYDGVLGQSLIHFLEERTADFAVVGNVVTRKVASRGDQVRIRFDNQKESDSDNDGRGRRNRDRRLLTGEERKKSKKELEAGGMGKKAKHSKARRKQDKKDKNNARFNKNRQSFDPSAKVPGYVKHGPRKLKGRGVKKNIRSFKRAA